MSAQADLKGDNIRFRVLRNTISNYLGKLVVLGSGFFLTPFLLNHLGATTYGLWILIGSLVAYGSLLDFGIAGAVTKYVAEYRARGEAERLGRLVSTALVLYSAFGLLAAAMGLSLAPVLPHLFQIPPEQRLEASWLIALSGVALGISIPATTTSAVLRGLQRFDLVNLIGVIGTVLSVVATVLVVLWGGGLLGIVIAGAIITILMQVPGLWLIRRLAPEIKFSGRAASRELIRSVTSFSSSLFILNVAGQLQTETDEIVIGIFLPIRAVTPYSIAQRLSEVPRILTDQFMKVLPPLASELDAQSDRARLRTLYIVSTRLTLSSFVPFASVIVLLAGPLLTAWVGAEYASYSYLVLTLTVAGLIDTSQWPAGHVLQGMARHQPLAFMSVVSGIANLILSLILVQRFGLVGVAVGTLIPTTIECLLFVMPYTMRVLGVGWHEMLGQVLLPALVPAIPSALVIYVLRETFPLNSWPAIAAVALVGLMAYVVAYLSLGATSLERQTYGELARSTLQLARTRLKPS